VIGLKELRSASRKIFLARMKRCARRQQLRLALPITFWSIGELGDAGTDLNSLEVIVARLRRKIGNMIQTERGRGYRPAGDQSFIFPWRKVIIGF
jgi:DNA-binding response OmpR family regulator